jgi:hypothetical protein
LRSEIYLFVSSDIRDPYLISEEEHFGSDDTVTQNATIPAFFTVETKALTGGMYTSDQLKPNVRGLQNVKCYPIDLATQIDDNGNIYIDRTTNKPTDTNDVLKELREPSGTGQLKAQNSYDYGVGVREKRRFIFMLLKIFIVVILLIIIIYIAMYIIGPDANIIFSGRKSSMESIGVGTNIATGAAATAAASTLAVLGANGTTSSNKRNSRSGSNSSTPGTSARAANAAALAAGASALAVVGGT